MSETIIISHREYPLRNHGEIVEAHNLLANVLRHLSSENHTHILAAMATISWLIHDDKGSGPFLRLLANARDFQQTHSL